jgi:hypothetical protein
VHKNVTNLIVKTVSELESRVKNYHEKMKNGGFACMRQVAGMGRWEAFFKRKKRSGSRG